MITNMITKCVDNLFHEYAGFETHARKEAFDRRNPSSSSAPRLLATFILMLILTVTATTAATAQTYTDLYNFGTRSGDPASPTYSGIIAQGRDGNLYSTAPYGGAYNKGAVFMITPPGTLTVLHSFDGTDGANPWAGLTLGTDGNFYGVASSGGAFGYGTIYKITTGGSLTTLHSFTNGTDAAAGISPPIQGSDGNFYGVADGPISTLYANGIVYELTPSGVFTTLHTFTGGIGGAQGSHPDAPLVQGANGYFYGSTYWGGANGYGTIFRISSTGDFELLFSFSQFDQNPEAAMIQGSDGAFYGTTTEYANGGIVFRLTDPGGLTVLYDFSAGTPYAGLVQATDGFFYGATAPARFTGGPTIFRISSTGAFVTLYDFVTATGYDSVATQVQHTNGVLYGDTNLGGTYGLGVFYSYDVGLGPFVTFVNTFGAVGQTAEILGQGLTGTTGVSFNGVSASFNVESDTYLTATVPVGATTGPVTVTTPTGTLTSNKSFNVLTAAPITVSPLSLSFGSQLLNTTSQPQTVTLTAGAVKLNISGIIASGNFSQTNTCGSSVLPGASCTVTVTYTPTSTGTCPEKGTLTISDDALGSPQVVTLSGFGSVVALSTNALNFGDQPTGTTSSAQTITFTNESTSRAVGIAGISISGPNSPAFAETNNCGTSLAAGSSCSIAVTFTPHSATSKVATLNVWNNGSGTVQQVTLTGNGT